MSGKNSDADSLHKLYLKRIAHHVPFDNRNMQSLSFERMHYLLAQHCKIPKSVRHVFIRELEEKGLIVVESRMQIVLCVETE